METKNQNPIIVTWDFTHVSEYALEHAIRISRTVDKGITLLHIVPKGISEIEKEGKLEKMNWIADETMRLHQIRPSVEIIEGTIFTQISEYSNSIKATFVVMGTHGIKGAQKLFGSWALKVIVGTTAPFIVVQSKPETLEKYSNIVFPIDFKSENREKLNWAIYFGKFFNSKVHLYRYPVADKWLLKKVDANLNFAIRFLIQNKLDYEIHLPTKSKDFSKDTIEFAQNINADLILTMTTKYIFVLDYMFGAKEQIVIANSAKIPVLCINPKANFAAMGQFMYGS